MKEKCVDSMLYSRARNHFFYHEQELIIISFIVCNLTNGQFTNGRSATQHVQPAELVQKHFATAGVHKCRNSQKVFSLESFLLCSSLASGD